VPVSRRGQPPRSESRSQGGAAGSGPDAGRDAGPDGGPTPVPGALSQALRECAADGFSGALRVTGEPGGTIHVVDGGVVAIDTPGAPGPEVILISSGRVAESAWKDAFASAAADGRMGDELVRRDLIGSGELEALLRTVLADAMFALASGQVETCQAEPAVIASLLPLEPPAEPGWLVSEASRRLRTLAATPGWIDHDRDRVTRGSQAPPPGTPMPGGREAILALANGRRTARDMAFALGWGVYAITLEFARMHDAGLLAVSSRRGGARARPREPWPPLAATGRAPGTDPAGDGGDGPPPALPRRRRGQSSPPRRGQAPVTAPSNSAALLRRLRPGPGTGQDPDT
jgi:hypothetical protein